MCKFYGIIKFLLKVRNKKRGIMGIIRNFIDIVGITPENELPKEIKGQLIQTSETENIFIANEVSDIKNIYQIVIDMEVKGSRVICVNHSKVVVIDCVKKTKIVYYNSNDSVSVLDLITPYNTFVEINEKEEIDDIKICIADAYFELINKGTLYSHILYFINVIYCKATEILKKDEKYINTEKINNSYYKGNNELKYKEQVNPDKECTEIERQSDKINDFKNIEKNNIMEEMSVAKDSLHTVEIKDIKKDSFEDDSLIDLEAEYL